MSADFSQARLISLASAFAGDGPFLPFWLPNLHGLG